MVVVLLADVKLAADDGFDPVLVSGIDEVDSAEDVAVIGHGHSRHAEFLDALTEFFYVAGAIEQGVVGVEVEVDELGHGRFVNWGIW